MSPTSRSLALLRERGYKAAVAEKWNHFAKIRQDLFGCIDIVAVGHGRTLGVQACIAGDIAARVAKMGKADALPELIASNWTMLVMGWRKPANSRSWISRTVRVYCSGATVHNEGSSPDSVSSFDVEAALSSGAPDTEPSATV